MGRYKLVAWSTLGIKTPVQAIVIDRIHELDEKKLMVNCQFYSVVDCQTSKAETLDLEDRLAKVKELAGVPSHVEEFVRFSIIKKFVADFTGQDMWAY